jgi:hypothetical protein
MAGGRIRALMVLAPLRPADAPLFDAEICSIIGTGCECKSK